MVGSGFYFFNWNYYSSPSSPGTAVPLLAVPPVRSFPSCACPTSSPSARRKGCFFVVRKNQQDQQKNPFLCLSYFFAFGEKEGLLLRRAPYGRYGRYRRTFLCLAGSSISSIRRTTKKQGARPAEEPLPVRLMEEPARKRTKQGGTAEDAQEEAALTK